MSEWVRRLAGEVVCRLAIGATGALTSASIATANDRPPPTVEADPTAIVSVCLNYGQDERLTGKLHERVYPGPPEFESVERGDTPVPAFVLQLKNAACIDADPEDQEGLSPMFLRVAETQIQVSDAVLEQLRSNVGNEVELTGRVWMAETGYHNTPVMLSVSAVEVKRELSDDTVEPGPFSELVKTAFCNDGSKTPIENLRRLRDSGAIDARDMQREAIAAMSECRDTPLGADPWDLRQVFSRAPDYSTMRLAQDVKELTTQRTPAMRGIEFEVSWPVNSFEYFLMNDFESSNDEVFEGNLRYFFNQDYDFNQFFCGGQTPLAYLYARGATTWLNRFVLAGGDINRPFIPVGKVVGDGYEYRQYTTTRAVIPFDGRFQDCPQARAYGVEDTQYVTALQMALGDYGPGFEERISILLDLGANVFPDALHSTFADNGNFRLQPWTEEHQQIFDRLISYGADINAPDIENRTYLARAMTQPLPERALEYLLSKGASMTPSQDTGDF